MADPLEGCQAYGDRPCRYPAGHECSHSYEGKCTERAADGRLCDLPGGHEAETPHDWMETFGNPKIRCRTIWTQERGGYGRVWRCMFRQDHVGDCSFEIGPDRVARITTDARSGRRPSIPDTWWLIAHIWTLRQQLADAGEAIRQWATIAATGHDTEGERDEDR